MNWDVYTKVNREIKVASNIKTFVFTLLILVKRHDMTPLRL